MRIVFRLLFIVLAFLQLSAFAANLKIETTPAEVSVFVDGIFLGTTPGVYECSEGSHLFEYRKEGYETVTKEVSISRSTNLHEVLKGDRDLLEKYLIGFSLLEYRIRNSDRMRDNVVDSPNYFASVASGLNLKAHYLFLRPQEIERVVEGFDVSPIKNWDLLDYRWVVLGQLVYTQNDIPDGISRSRIELWIYDVEEEEFLTSLSLEAGSKGHSSDTASMKACIENVMPEVLELFVVEILKQKNQMEE